MATGIAWLYVINGSGPAPEIRRTSHDGITVTVNQPGEYVVTLPFRVSGLAAVGTLGNSVGMITVVPGENTGLALNQIRVLTLTMQNQLSGAFDFSLAVFFRARWPWLPWVVAVLVALALFTFVGR